MPWRSSELYSYESSSPACCCATDSACARPETLVHPKKGSSELNTYESSSPARCCATDSACAAPQPYSTPKSAAASCTHTTPVHTGCRGADRVTWGSACAWLSIPDEARGPPPPHTQTPRPAGARACAFRDALQRRRCAGRTGAGPGHSGMLQQSRLSMLCGAAAQSSEAGTWRAAAPLLSTACGQGRRPRLRALQHLQHVRQVGLERVADGDRDVAECGQDLRLDVALHVVGLQVGQQHAHDRVAVRRNARLDRAAHVAQHAHRHLAHLPLLRGAQAAG